jgi:hypothetical protein
MSLFNEFMISVYLYFMMGLTDLYKQIFKILINVTQMSFLGDCLGYILIITCFVNILKTLYVYINILIVYIKMKMKKTTVNNNCDQINVKKN